MFKIKKFRVKKIFLINPLYASWEISDYGFNYSLLRK